VTTDQNTDVSGGGTGAQPSSALPKVLFICTGNSCRSQMAEGWMNFLFGDHFEAFSAGIAPQTLDPRAVKAMAETGVDISDQTSKHIDDLRDIAFDLVVTVCDKAREACPVFAGGTIKLHRGFDDPPRLARSAHTEEEALAHYRHVRDEIRAFVEELPALLGQRFDPASEQAKE
jgi:arsenate reductase